MVGEPDLSRAAPGPARGELALARDVMTTAG